MELKMDIELEGYEITKGIKFYRETNKDSETCQKLSELDDLIDDILFHLNQVEQDTLSEPNNKSGKEIREQINGIYATLQKNIYERDEE